MEYTKKDIGFKNTDELEQLIFTRKELFDKSARYAQRHNIYYVEVEADVPSHHTAGMLLRCQDAAIFKPSYDYFKNLDVNLLE